MNRTITMARNPSRWRVQPCAEISEAHVDAERIESGSQWTGDGADGIHH